LDCDLPRLDTVDGCLRSGSYVSDLPKRIGVSLPLLVLLVMFGVTLASGDRLLLDADSYLHVMIGRWIIAHGTVPHHDIFSYSMPDAPWVAHEWLAAIVFAHLHDLFGWPALEILTAFSFAAAMGLLTRGLLRFLPPSHALIGMALAAGLCFPHLFARPHVLSWPLLVIWFSELSAARAEQRAPRWYAALLMLPWANIHGSFVFGLVMAALVAGEAVLEASDWTKAARVARGWGLFGALSLAAALATPYGIDGLLLPFRLVHMDFALSAIREWQSPNFQLPQPLEPWLMLLLLGALTFGLRLPVTRIAMLLLLLHMALQHQRHAELLGLTAPLLLAPSLAAQLGRKALAAVDQRLAALAGPARTGGIALVGLLMLALSGIMIGVGIVPRNGPRAPAGALAFAHAQGLTGPVFNDINFGDYLIYVGIAPFIDGRVDMYGDEFVRRYADVGEFPALAAQYGFTWAVLSPGNPHVPLLDHLTGWQRAQTDNVAVVYVRE
jgi:hypothetical protein